MNALEDVFVNISEREVASAVAAAGADVVVDTATLNTDISTFSGVPMETLFREAAEVKMISKLFFQTWAVYLQKFLIFFRSMRLIISGIVIPIILVGSLAALIPDFKNKNFNSNLNHDGTHHRIAIYQTSNTWSPALNDLLVTFAAKYLEYETAIGRAGPTISLEKVSGLQFSAGEFLIGASLFTTPLMHIGFHDDCLEEMVAPNTPSASYTFFYEKSYDPLYLVPFQALMGASIEEVWRRHNNDARPVSLPVVIPVRIIPTLNMTATTVTPSAHGPHPSGKGSSSNESQFLLISLGVLIGCNIAWFAASSIQIVADELNRKIYHTLLLHGLSPTAYWVGTFLFDMSTGGSIVAAYIIGAFYRGGAQTEIMVHQCFVMLLTLSFSVMLAYSLVLVLPNLKPITYTHMICVLILMDMIPLIALALYRSTNNVLATPARLQFTTPAACLIYAVMDSPSYPASSKWSREKGGTWRTTYMSLLMWNGATVCVMLYKMYNFGPYTFVFRRNNNAQTPPQRSQGHAAPGEYPSASVLMNAEGTGDMLVADPDVLAEENRVTNSSPTENMAATVHLRKVYDSANRGKSAIFSLFGPKCEKVAVDDLTIGIGAGECFGLLGPSGAGKTTTINMMTRETRPTGGFVDFSYAHQTSKKVGGCFGNMDGAAYQAERLGVCHQGDTLWETLSAAEHLRLYLRIRLCGAYSERELTQYIESTVRKVGLEEAGAKQAGTYSGGMKRKLAVAIAMCTGARTMFLDEPSTGMDVYARRALWRSIREALQQRDRCVLLTTHSMEEADAVCDRIGIMTNGVLRCIGSNQHLKKRYGSEVYLIAVTLHPRDANGMPVVCTSATTAEAGQLAMMESPQAAAATEAAGRAVDAYIMETFGKYQCELKEVLGLQRRYSIGRLPALSFAFRVLQEQQDALGISHYSVSPLSSLEQIFIHIAGRTNNEGN